jgi:thioredoxin reductase (NADPH)
LFAAGDLTSGLDQIAVAVGQGAIVATAVHNGL